jgi:radical SAM protein with 4Fe4S-binding SPASM domain
MRFFNRAKLLWSFLAGRERVPALPVEYIVETTAKCNLYCPMCPRETHKQPKEDMTDQVFERLVEGSAHTAEHMMLIGLGEPLMDRKIFDRIAYCERHGISTLLSTNGTLLDEEASARLLDSPLAHITLSFDGASKETFEHYRKGARFEKVRDNFVRFARMKKERGSKLQVVAQMVRMPGNAHEVDAFRSFWGSVPGVDQVRVKEDETNLVQESLRANAVLGESAGGKASKMTRCHYLWRGAMYVKHDGRVFPCCQSYSLDGAPVGNLRAESLPEIFNSNEMLRLRRLHAQGRGAEIEMCSRCSTPIPHPALAAASLLVHGKWVRRALPFVERLIRGRRLPERLLSPARTELVQIQKGSNRI